jgi:hypothetical protein
MQLPIGVAGPQMSGPLTLFPIHSTAPCGPEYLCGPEAEVLGALVIHEAEAGARVPELVIENSADRPMLLIEGETLVGIQQNRTLNVSVLCPASAATTIPVSCVEAGRWDAPEAGARSRHHAPSRLRGRKTASVVAAMRSGRGRVSDQAQVWADVDDYSLRVGAESPTRALEDAHIAAHDKTQALLRDVRPKDDQCGVLTAIGGLIVSLDLFDKPSSLAAYWDGLVAGYAMEAAGAPDVPVNLADAKAFAAAVATAGSRFDPAVGLGHDVRLAAPGIVGLGLEWDGTIVHLAAFASETPPGDTRPIRRRRRS